MFLQEGQNYYTLGRDILSCHIQPLPNPCPPGVPELVYCMLQPDPADRPDIEQAGIGCNTQAAILPGPTLPVRCAQRLPSLLSDNVLDAACAVHVE